MPERGDLSLRGLTDCGRPIESAPVHDSIYFIFRFRSIDLRGGRVWVNHSGNQSVASVPSLQGMKLSKAQQNLHWSLWKKAKAKLMQNASPARTRETWTKAEENERRHAIYLEALGEDASLTDMTNRQFDLVIGALRSIIEPGNLNAQLHALNGQQKRLLYGIRDLAHSMGADEAYLQGIIDRMDARRGEPERDDDDEPLDRWERERLRDEKPQRRLEQLSPAELTKIMVALKKHEARGAIYDPACHDIVTSEVEVPF